MEFLNTQDIKMNLLHERELTIARCNQGEGNMRLSVDERGVNFEFEAPRCDIGDRALELVRTGVYSGCSFEFYPQEYEVEERGNEVIIRHSRFKAIGALTLGMDPAYKQTSVNARELYEQTETGKAEIAQREAEEQAKREEEIKESMVAAAQRRRQLLDNDIEF
jgi:phage head maturation protease